MQHFNIWNHSGAISLQSTWLLDDILRVIGKLPQLSLQHVIVAGHLSSDWGTKLFTRRIECIIALLEQSSSSSSSSTTTTKEQSIELLTRGYRATDIVSLIQTANRPDIEFKVSNISVMYGVYQCMSQSCKGMNVNTNRWYRQCAKCKQIQCGKCSHSDWLWSNEFVPQTFQCRCDYCANRHQSFLTLNCSCQYRQ
jgi:hypothetical protein